MKEIFRIFKIKLNFQIVIAVIISMFIAKNMNLKYYTTSGIITLLTIQNTKKDTLDISYKRVLVFIMMLIFSYIIYNTMGYTIEAFGILVFILASISSALNITVGLSMNSVLASHFLDSASMSLDVVQNETILFLIGISMGVLVNLTTPLLFYDFKQDIKEVDDAVKELIEIISLQLRGVCPDVFGEKLSKEDCNLYIDKRLDEINLFLKQKENRVLEKSNNLLFYEEKYYLNYIEMRVSQVHIISDIHYNTKKLYMVHNHAIKISDFMMIMKEQYNEAGNIDKIISGCESLLEDFKKSELPKTREEFEIRAVLYAILHDLLLMLNEKKSFVLNLTEYEKKKYWNLKRIDN